MTPQSVLSMGHEAMVITILLAAPPLGIGLVVGVIVSVMQAVTSIQEMTLAFIPRILSVGVAIVVFGPWMLMMMLNYMGKILGSLHTFAR